jgi:hypothetical protein
LPGGTEKNHKNLSEDSGSLGQDLKLGLPEYGAGMLTTMFSYLNYTWIQRFCNIREVHEI